MTYQLLPINLSGDPQMVINLENDRVFQVTDGGSNTDYQEYLEWVAEGNTPLPADD